jgi:acyl-CoA reductase-like NAD-dependent aldehyde dehydrogenase
MFLAGRPETTDRWLEVRRKYPDGPLAEVALAAEAHVLEAGRAAERALPALRRLSSGDRRERLWLTVRGLEQRAEAFAATLVAEVGKTVREARAEVARAVETFRLAAEETVRFAGEEIVLDGIPRGRGYRGWTRRVPLGPAAFVTPFNFPLNLVAHKVAPALAVGVPFVLKPASRTPLVALMLGELLAEADWPEGTFSILPMDRRTGDVLVSDPRYRIFSFTGSDAVGWPLMAAAGKKRVLMELGGNAACYVDASADVEDALPRIVIGAYGQAGQSCISVQRVYAHQAVYDQVRDGLVARTRSLVTGDPADEKTDVGPLIAEDEAKRLERWIAEATAGGAKLLCGGERRGAFLTPAIVENPPTTAKLVREEAFGPVLTLAAVPSAEAAFAAINDSRYGLQAGVFTDRLSVAEAAWRSLDVGGVVVNDVPTWRSDAMPYGGVKDSGLGREGVRAAMEEMTELRSCVLREKT